jgi:uncharacterized membrane protein YhaH (DUF805 family)
MGMREIVASVRRGLGNTLRFSGRDTRGQFWPYAIFLFLASTALTYVAMLPDLVRMMTGVAELIEKAQRDEAAGRPAAAPFRQGSEVFPPELMPNFENSIIWSAVLTGISILLLAAAVTRRLHDRDKSGFWGLLPLPSAVLGLAFASRVIDMMARMRTPTGLDTPLMPAIMLNGVVYWALLIFLIVILAGEGDPGPNRFGPAPAPAAEQP